MASGENKNNEKVYRFGDFTIDGENFRARRGEENITLTPRAFDVLIFLLKSGGRIIEKQEIFETVWKDTFVSDNALTKIVREIRQVLGDSIDAPRYIETVPKRGYRFIAEVKNGSAKTDEEEISEPVKTERRRSRKKYLIFGAVGLLALISIIFAFIVFLSESSAETAPIDSIAVLPFENSTQDADLEYLSDGIAENVTNTLSRLPNLRVLPRSTVFYYKGKKEDPHTIGRMLRVRAVLSGRISRRGDTLYIQTELIDIDRKAQIWGQQYNRSLTDVFNVQELIALEITSNLRLHLTGAEQQQIARRFTENSEAYQNYLQGRFYWNKRTPKDLQKSVEFLQRAVALDANFALAFAALADSYAQLSNYGGAPPREAMPKAKDAVLKALALDDELSEAHNAYGFILMCYDFDFAGAEREFRRAVELNPNNAAAHQFYANLLMYLGRTEESFSEYRRALEIDPLSLILNRMYGESLLYARRYDEAIAQYRKTLDLNENFASARASLSVAYQLKGEYAAAVEEFARAQEIIGEQRTGALARESFARGGWQEFLRAMTAKNEKINLPLYTSAAFEAARGEKEAAISRLETAFENRDHYLIWIKIDPRLDELRNEPRFQNLMRRVGF